LNLKESAILFGFLQTQQYLFCFVMTTCFGPLTIIRPFPQNSEQIAAQFKLYGISYYQKTICTVLHLFLSFVEMAWWWSVDWNMSS